MKHYPIYLPSNTTETEKRQIEEILAHNFRGTVSFKWHEEPDETGVNTLILTLKYAKEPHPVELLNMGVVIGAAMFHVPKSVFQKKLD